MVSPRRTVPWPPGWMVIAGAPSAPSTTSFTILPRGSRCNHQVLACTLLIPCLFFLYPHFGRRCRRKRLRQPASPQRVNGRASLPNSSVQWMSLTRTPQLSVSSATDLALHTTKMTAQAIGRSMPSLVVLERHLWLNLTEMKDVDNFPSSTPPPACLVLQ